MPVKLAAEEKTTVKLAEPEKTEPKKTPVADKAETAKTPAAEKATEKKAPVRKATTRRTATKKAATKTTAAKKTTAKKEIKVNAFVEYYGKQVEEKDIIASVKKAWTSTGKKVGDIKSMDLYIKPEEGAVYYVINGTETGAVAF